MTKYIVTVNGYAVSEPVSLDSSNFLEREILEMSGYSIIPITIPIDVDEVEAESV